MNAILERFRMFLSSLTRPYPSRDWFVVLIVVFIVLLASVLYAGYLLVGIRSGGIISVSEGGTPPQPSITKGDISRVLDSYHARQVNFDAHNFQIQKLVDPQ